MKEKQIIKYIAGWLNSYCERSSMKGFVVGISGGVDSALTSTLCALTRKPVICLNMPILQHKDQYSLANEHIKWLKKIYNTVSSHEINLTDAFLKFKETLPKEIQDNHTMANTRSRLRMLTLYSFSTHHKFLVVGTGNKVEDFGVGFYTKYGDGGVDISPIAGLMKSEVRALAEELGVSSSIIKAAPVDGLWEDNRTDEQQIGATYDELEWAMEQITSNFKLQTSKLNSRQKKVLEIFQRLNKMNEHKMKPIPVCIIPKKLKKS
ncbi:MAG: NAD(+) synthase [Bacteroidia bacterium]